MTKTKSNQQIPSLRVKAVKLTPDALEYLCGTTKNGASRLGAYFSLLQDAVETTTSFMPPYGQSFNMEAGQLVISITDLSKRWEWARETVRKFFDRLEALHLLTKEQLDRCSLITMKIEWLEVGYSSVLATPFPYFELPQYLHDQMDGWLNGDISDADLLESIGNTVETFDNTDVNVSSHQILTLQYALIRQLIKKWAVSYPYVSETPDESSYKHLSKLFNQVLSGNWVLWLKLLKELSPGVSEKVLALDDSKDAAFIANGREILDSLFHHMKVDFTQERL